MRDKIYKALKTLYGITMTVAFFGGVLPLLPFLLAILIGGPTGQAISVFLYKQYYPWIIALASIAVIIGLIGMYVGKQEALSAKCGGPSKICRAEIPPERADLVALLHEKARILESAYRDDGVFVATVSVSGRESGKFAPFLTPDEPQLNQSNIL